LQYNFVGWVGSVNSRATQLNVTMDGPKTLTADFSVNYNSIFVPLIIIVGIAGAVVVVFLRRRSHMWVQNEPEQLPMAAPEKQTLAAELPGAEESKLTCPKCGLDIERDWTFCIHCRQKLAS